MPKLEVDWKASARAELRDARDAVVRAMRNAVDADLDTDEMAGVLEIPPRTVRSLSHNWLTSDGE